MDYEAFLQFVRTRRTIRAIEPDPIPEGVVAKLIDGEIFQTVRSPWQDRV